MITLIPFLVGRVLLSAGLGGAAAWATQRFGGPSWLAIGVALAVYGLATFAVGAAMYGAMEASGI